MRTLVVLGVILAIGLPTVVQADQKSDDIAKLMSLEGDDTASLRRVYTVKVEPILQRFIIDHPQLTPDAIESMRHSVNRDEEAFFQVFIDKTAALYNTDLSETQLQGLIAFFQSPLGQAYLHERTAVANASSALTAEETPVLGSHIRADLLAALNVQSSR